jgi:hypothetical protein
MAFMQGSHGRHESDGAVVEELFAAPLSEVGDCTEDFDGCVGYDLVPLSSIQEVGA